MKKINVIIKAVFVVAILYGYHVAISTNKDIVLTVRVPSIVTDTIGILDDKLNDTSNPLTYPENEDKETDRFIRLVAPTIKERRMIPLSVAIAILETNRGRSLMYKETANLFGIKGNKKNSQLYKGIKYIKFNSVVESIEYYHNLMNTTYKNCKDSSTIKEQCDCIQRSGYSQDPDYSNKIQWIIKKYKLNKIK